MGGYATGRNETRRAQVLAAVDTKGAGKARPHGDLRLDLRAFTREQSVQHR